MPENVSNLFKFSVDDYYRLADVGILTHEDKVELIEGQIVVRNPDKSPAHSACVTRLGDVLRSLLYAQYDIPETWVVDLATKTMNGEYGNKQTFRRGDVLESGTVKQLLVNRVIK